MTTTKIFKIESPWLFTNKDANALLLLGVYKQKIVLANPFETVIAGYESESSKVQKR